jgi:hypothetical protein
VKGIMMKRLVLRFTLGIAIVMLVGCATAPPAFRLTPDGAKEFVLTMRAGSFSPNYLVVNQGDRVRLVIYSYYQFAFFTFNEFGVSRMVPHNAPEVVEFVATQRGWFDFKGYGFWAQYSQLTLAASVDGTDSSEHVLYGRLYVQ